MVICGNQLLPIPWLKKRYIFVVIAIAKIAIPIKKRITTRFVSHDFCRLRYFYCIFCHF